MNGGKPVTAFFLVGGGGVIPGLEMMCPKHESLIDWSPSVRVRYKDRD